VEAKDRLLEDLTEKADGLENLNKELMRNHITKEHEYLGRIESLEGKLLGSDKYDYILLQKHNREYEMELNNLNKTYQNLAIKYEDDSKRFGALTKELLVLKDELINELTALEDIRNNIMNKGLKKDKPARGHKLEMVMRYNQPEDSDISLNRLESADIVLINNKRSHNINNSPLNINDAQLSKKFFFIFQKT
jgi:hypothetical protein